MTYFATFMSALFKWKGFNTFSALITLTASHLQDLNILAKFALIKQ